MNDQYKIEGYTRDLFIIDRVETVGDALETDLKRRNFDGKIYYMDRVVTGRKLPFTVVCFKATNHNTFIPTV